MRVLARAKEGECQEMPGVLCCQLAGQMALDMRPRSTCRRLTKAIPVPDMTEACHADLDTVQLYPSCGHPCPGMWNKGVVAHMRCGTACPARPDGLSGMGYWGRAVRRDRRRATAPASPRPAPARPWCRTA